MAAEISLRSQAARLNINTYGHLLPVPKQQIIHNWIAAHPIHTNFLSAFTAPAPSTSIYIDWLNWTHHDALRWLRKLDRVERRYRVIGLAYHKVPYAIRHPTFGPLSNKTNVLAYMFLAQILEPDQERGEITFFRPWKKIEQVVFAALENVRRWCTPAPGGDDDEELRRAIEGMQHELSALEKSWRLLVEGLMWLENAVAVVVEWAGEDAPDVLAEKFSREGGLFRGWIQTFPEMMNGVVGREFMDNYALRMLKYGVERYPYWTAFCEPISAANRS